MFPATLRHYQPIIHIIVIICFAGRCPAAETSLVKLDSRFDIKSVQTTDATASLAVSPDHTALRVTTGKTHTWPGITLPAPGGKWDLSPYEQFSAEIRNLGKEPITVNCRVDNPGADGTANCLNGRISLQPGEAGTLTVHFIRAWPLKKKLFGMRGYPYGMSGNPIDPANVTQILFYINKPSAGHTWEVSNLRAGGSYQPPPENFFPLIDAFGQYIHRDWPGKVHSLDELRLRRQQEEADLAANPGPTDWNAWGGWSAGPTLKATGFFRVEKHQGKWWLVDPDGRLFFSQGIDCVRMADATPIDDRKDWFADFPGDKPDFAEFLSSPYCLKGYYAGKNPRCFSFASANLKRKYGNDWQTQVIPVIHRRLRSWGLNTIANWSDGNVAKLRKTPYTANAGFGRKPIEGSDGYWGKFPDPFDPANKASVERAMQRHAGGAAGDPWCIGFFVDNEMSWGDETSLAIATLKSPPEQPAKLAFIADLKAKYTTIDRLNSAWSTKHESWDALLASRVAPEKAKAEADLKAFYTHIAEQYFRTVRDAVKQVAPNQLYLGCRFAWTNPLAASAAAKFCDVVSYNLYRRSVANLKMPGGQDVPLIIGEFHFGALDRGMFHTGLVPTKNQTARAKAYAEYVRGALQHPQFVGCHWFQYQDQPTTGRVYDEENYQIGFVDIADTPYAETIAACREVGKGMYPLRLAAPQAEPRR